MKQRGITAPGRSVCGSTTRRTVGGAVDGKPPGRRAQGALSNPNSEDGLAPVLVLRARVGAPAGDDAARAAGRCCGGAPRGRVSKPNSRRVVVTGPPDLTGRGGVV